MDGKKTRPKNQTVFELYQEYQAELDNYINFFYEKFGYLPRDINSFEFKISPVEVQAMSKAFWNHKYIRRAFSLSQLYWGLLQ